MDYMRRNFVVYRTGQDSLAEMFIHQAGGLLHLFLGLKLPDDRST